LDRFRSYLRELHEPEAAPANEPAPFDWAAMVGQFTALRHDVNLQTKAVRASAEQTAEVLKTFARPAEAPAASPSIKPILEIADTLALALKQVERSTESLMPLLEELQAPIPQPRRGLFAKWFGGATEPPPVTELLAKLEPTLEGISEGYSMSLRRVEKLLEQLGLTPIDALGKAFDPELMEVIEVIAGTGEEAGTVVDVLRRGYRQAGNVFRFAQVKVAR